MSLPKSLTTVTPFSKFLALALFIIFPLVGFVFGMQYQYTVDLYYRQLADQYPATITRHPTPTPNKTVYTEASRSANWKTYVNDKYHISFQYPPTLFLNVYPNGFSDEIILSDSEADLKLIDKCGLGNGCTSNVLSINLSTMKEKPKNQTLRSYVSQNTRENDPSYYQPKTIDGYNALQLEWQAGGKVISTFVDQGNRILYINAIVGENRHDQDKVTELLKQILSTFRFLQ